MSIFPSRNMNDQNPFTKNAYNLWDGLKDTAKDQWWNPAGWVVSGYDLAGQGSEKFTEGTPLGNTQGNWDGSKILEGSKDMALGTLQSVGTVAGGGGVYGAGKGALRGATRLAEAGGKAGIAKGTFAGLQRGAASGAIRGSLSGAKTGLKKTFPKFGPPARSVGRALNTAQDVAFNPVSLFNPGRYASGTLRNKVLSNAPSRFQNFARLAHRGAGAGLKNRAKTLGAITGSSLLSPVNWNMIGNSAARVAAQEHNFGNPLSNMGAYATGVANELPYLVSRGGVLPWFVQDELQQHVDRPDLYANKVHEWIGNARQNATTPTTNPYQELVHTGGKYADRLAPEDLAFIQERANESGFLDNFQSQGGRWLAPGATPFTFQNPEQTSRDIWSQTRDLQNNIKEVATQSAPQNTQPTETASTPTTQPKLSAWGTEMLMKIVNWLQQTGQSLEGLFAGK